MPYEHCDDGDFRRLWTPQRLLRRVVDNLVAETTQVIHKKTIHPTQSSKLSTEKMDLGCIEFPSGASRLYNRRYGSRKERIRAHQQSSTGNRQEAGPQTSYDQGQGRGTTGGRRGSCAHYRTHYTGTVRSCQCHGYHPGRRQRPVPR